MTEKSVIEQIQVQLNSLICPKLKHENRKIKSIYLKNDHPHIKLLELLCFDCSLKIDESKAKGVGDFPDDLCNKLNSLQEFLSKEEAIKFDEQIIKQKLLIQEMELMEAASLLGQVKLTIRFLENMFNLLGQKLDRDFYKRYTPSKDIFISKLKELQGKSNTNQVQQTLFELASNKNPDNQEFEISQQRLLESQGNFWSEKKNNNKNLYESIQFMLTTTSLFVSEENVNLKPRQLEQIILADFEKNAQMISDFKNHNNIVAQFAVLENEHQALRQVCNELRERVRVLEEENAFLKEDNFRLNNLQEENRNQIQVLEHQEVVLRETIQNLKAEEKIPVQKINKALDQAGDDVTKFAKNLGSVIQKIQF